MKKITRNTILKEMQDMAWEDLFYYSSNYAMTEPKEGMADKWAEAKAKAEIVDQMVAELPFSHYDIKTDDLHYCRKFTGIIDGWGADTTHTDDPHLYIAEVNFAVEGVHDGLNPYQSRDVHHFKIDHQLGIDYLLSGQYDEERHARYNEGKDATVTLTVEVYGGMNIIRAIDWAD